MYGITGYLSDDPRTRDALPAMMAALVHRGPDLAIFFWGQESRHSHRDIIQRMGPGEHPWIFAARLVVELARLA